MKTSGPVPTTWIRAGSFVSTKWFILAGATTTLAAEANPAYASAVHDGASLALESATFGVQRQLVDRYGFGKDKVRVFVDEARSLVDELLAQLHW